MFITPPEGDPYKKCGEIVEEQDSQKFYGQMIGEDCYIEDNADPERNRRNQAKNNI